MTKCKKKKNVNACVHVHMDAQRDADSRPLFFTAVEMNMTVLFSCLHQLGNNLDMAAQVQTSPL